MNKKILVVDDEPDIRDSLAEFLKRKGYTVVTAADGREAIETCRIEPPGLVVTDIKMPEKTGLEVLHELKKMDSNILVFMLSAYDHSVDSLRLRADDYISKPPDYDYLSFSIKKAFKAKSDEMELEKLKRVDIERGALVSAIRYLVHELNTPLNGLNGSLQILEEYIEENSEEHDLIKMSLESAGKLGRFVSAFNQYINISPEDFSPRIADIEKITLSALDRIELEMRQYGRENLKIEMRTEGRGPFECYAETKVLQDSLRECVLNSARRMESGTIIVCISEEADEVKLSVIDQGSGIEDKYKSRVFLPGGWSHDINYHSSIEDNPYEFGRSGYGFGLARIKKSIEMCGGRIDFDTEFGKGTSFFIFFPLNAPGNKANNG